jgi:diguanylate cyclase (GGDEF)-like protein/PAS domain S-box-containing protein
VTKTLLNQEAIAERIEFILEGTNAGTWDWDITSGSLYINARWAEIIGYDLDEVVPHIDTWKESLHPDDLASAEAELKLHFSTEKDYYDVLFRQAHKQGHWVWVNARGKVVERGQDDQPLRMSGVHIDVTKHKLTEERLRLIAKAYEHAREGIFITDSKGNILEVNNAFITLTGYGREEVTGKMPAIMKSDMHPPEFYTGMLKTIKDEGTWSGEIYNRHKKGRLITQLLTISSVFSDEGNIQNYIAIFTDITDLKDKENQIKKVKYFDPLTNLPNHTLLIERLDHLIAFKELDEEFYIINLDIDNLGEINKSQSFGVGDTLIVNTVERIKTLLNKNDILSCIGGDSFIIVLTEKRKAKDYEDFYERLKTTINTPHHINGIDVHLTASIGVAFYPHDGETSDLLLRNSGQALFKAKLEGKDRYELFDANQNTSLKEKHLELRKIKLGLQNNQFVLHYQPKVDMRNGKVIGAEALIRWQHPDRGMVYPDGFLPLVADNILNIDIGEWVIETALKQIAIWNKMGLDIPVSVNIDGTHLQQQDFIQRLKELLNDYPDVAPSSIELEILETNSLDDVRLISSLLKECTTDLGVKFALDDFGTGYSSLTYLKQLPVDLIKIDQTFVRDMFSDASDLAIIKGIVGLADSFKIKVIAEGVETIEHARALLALGCYLGQGYGIAKPMPAELIPQWIENWTEEARW